MSHENCGTFRNWIELGEIYGGFTALGVARSLILFFGTARLEINVCSTRQTSNWSSAPDAPMKASWFRTTTRQSGWKIVLFDLVANLVARRGAEVRIQQNDRRNHASQLTHTLFGTIGMKDNVSPVA